MQCFLLDLQMILGGQLTVSMTLPSEKVTLFAASSHGKHVKQQVSFLPALILNFTFPPGYPATEAPSFTLTCKWFEPLVIIHHNSYCQQTYVIVAKHSNASNSP